MVLSNTQALNDATMTVKSDALKSEMVRQKMGGWMFRFCFDCSFLSEHALLIRS